MIQRNKDQSTLPSAPSLSPSLDHPGEKDQSLNIDPGREAVGAREPVRLLDHAA